MTGKSLKVLETIRHKLSDLACVEEMNFDDIPSVLEIQAAEDNLSYWSFSDYEKMVKDESFLKFVAKMNEQAIGFIIGRLIKFKDANNQHDSHRNEAEIFNIAICDAYKKSGIGTKIVNAFLQTCARQFAETLWLEVRESNFRAIRFYEKTNFRKAYVRKNYYRNPAENALVMKLTTCINAELGAELTKRKLD